MDDWTSGYRADIGYIFGYYNELNPAYVRLALLNAGYDCPQINTACELGFGQGLSIIFHGAGSDTEWYGNDFIPEQAAFAESLAQHSGAKISLFDDSFEDFSRRSDLPKFDFIGLHGIWSWVSAENRKFITRFIQERLNLGGIVYISYNTHPGWSTFAPMRHLMLQHTEVMGTKGAGVTNRIEDTIQFASEFLKCNPKYASINPSVAARIEGMQKQDRHYLAHEYFNEEWHLMHFSTLANILKGNKLEFGCSGYLLDHIDAINFTSEQAAFIEKIPDMVLKESTKDFMINQTFRRDLWIKGTPKLTALERFERLRDIRVILCVPRSMVKLKVSAHIGEVNLREEIYKPLLDILADHSVATIDNLVGKLNANNITASHIIEAILVLAGSGYVAVAREEQEIESAASQTKKLNHALMVRARSQGEISYLSSPVTGGGVKVNRFHQLFLLARSMGMKNTDEWVKFAWDILSRQNQKLIKDGKALESDEENIQELNSHATELEKDWLPLLQSLRIA